MISSVHGVGFMSPKPTKWLCYVLWPWLCIMQLQSMLGRSTVTIKRKNGFLCCTQSPQVSLSVQLLYLVCKQRKSSIFRVRFWIHSILHKSYHSFFFLSWRRQGCGMWRSDTHFMGQLGIQSCLFIIFEAFLIQVVISDGITSTHWAWNLS